MKKNTAKFGNIIRKYPISVFFFVVIWYLSFFTPPKTELNEVAFIDKWVHVAMYGGTCSMIWIETLRARRPFPGMYRMLVYSWLCPILMSGLIELLQAYCTGGRRSGDWIDLAANATGVTLAALFGLALRKFH